MFDYTDPVGTGVLAAQGALSNFRRIVDRLYGDAVTTTGTLFTRLERMTGAPAAETITWKAFPITAGKPDVIIDAQRYDFQDEYVEWQVTRNAGRITRVTFTTEFPEYYEALAEVGADALIAGVRDAIPGTNPTVAELFGAGFNPETATPAQRAARFRDFSVVPFNSPQGTVPPNVWTNGTKGILCLGQRFNTAGALFNLAEQCCVPTPGIPPSSKCASTGGACGPNRNSDPRICTRAQEVSRLPRPLSLRDPVGIRLITLEGVWRTGGTLVSDINDPTANGGLWTVSRNGRRGVLEVPADLTVNGASIDSGTQVSRLLEVGADVVSVPPSALAPLVAAGAAAVATASPKLSRI